MKSRVCRWFALILLLVVGAAKAEVLAPDESQSEYNLGPYLEVLEDPEGTLTIEDVAGDFSNRFEPCTQVNPNFGITESVFWLRFTLDMSTAAERGHQWFLVERHPIIDHIYLYSPAGQGTYLERHMGDAVPFSERWMSHREFIFPLSEAGLNGPQTWYVKIHGKGALNLSLRLSDAKGLVERTYAEQLIFGLFYGGLLVMLVYNLLLYFSVRDKAYLHYIVFLSGFALGFMNIDGLGLQYFWPDLPKLNEHFPLFLMIALFGLLQYSRTFLNLARLAPKLDALFRRLVHVSVCLMVVVVLLPAPWSYFVIVGVVMVLAVVMSSSAWKVWRAGYTAARLYLVAWSFFLIGCVVFALYNIKLLPISMWAIYAPHIGTVWAAMFLSLALGDRIKLLEQERDEAENHSREALSRHYDEVRRLDHDKLVFLEYLSHELNTPLNWLNSVRMLEHGELPKEVTEALTMVHKGQDRLVELVSTSLRYFDIAGRKQFPEKQWCQPMWMLDEYMREHTQLLDDRELKVLNRIAADLEVPACCDELQEVINHVMDNAIQFSPDESTIEAWSEVEPEQVRLCFSDQGKGVLQEDLEGIFEPFFMVGSGHREDGFGLSLPISRVMLEQMGGEMYARSEGRNKGTVICICLPVS